MSASDPDGGRARRKELELLQARLKEAREDLEAPHTLGYAEDVKQLIEDALSVDAEAIAREREASAATSQLAAFRHDVEEAERQLLAPKTVMAVGPATVAVSFAGFVGCVITLSGLLTQGPTLGGYVVLGALAVLPGPLVAWVWRRRLSGGGTFRNPS